MFLSLYFRDLYGKFVLQIKWKVSKKKSEALIEDCGLWIMRLVMKG